MKCKRQNILYVALATALLNGCSSEDELSQISGPADNVVRITASVSDLQTRSSFTESTLSEFGIGINNSKNLRYCYGNNKVTKQGDEWTPAGQMLWEKKNQRVDIYAYAPYNSSYTGNIYQATDFPVTVSTDQTNDTSSDFLLYKSTGFNPETNLRNGRVPISFKHALCKLNIKLTFKNEFGDGSLLTANPVSSVTVTGTKVKGECNFAKQEVKASSSATASAVTAWKESFTAQTSTTRAAAEYQCILIPQTVASGGFTIKIKAKVGSATKEFTWTSYSDVTFSQSQCQQINLVVGKDQVYVGGITVKGWKNSGSLGGGTF
jgi:hypothetical protein